MKKTAAKLALAGLLTIAVAGSASASIPDDKYCPGTAYTVWTAWIVFLLPQGITPGAWIKGNCLG